MVMLRDVDIANLVALGGWIRAFEIAAVTTQKNYSNEKAVKLARTDLIAYFVETLQGLEPKLRERAHLIQINKDLESLLASLGGHDPESENPQPKIIPTKRILSFIKFFNPICICLSANFYSFELFYF